MKVGMTFDLRDEYLSLGYDPEQVAEFDQVTTIDAMDGALQRLGHRTERIGHVRSLTRALADGKRWDLVFNIAEGLQGFSRESQVPALLEAYGIPYVFSDAVVCGITLNKALAKRLLRDFGIATPEFALVQTLADVDRVDLPLPLFAKPVAEGTSKGIGPDAKIVSQAQLRRVCRHLLETYSQPVLVEKYLPGLELTVGLLGTGDDARAVAALEFRALRGADAADVYTFMNKEECEHRVVYEVRTDDIAERACALALRAWRALGCRDGGRVDLRQNEAGDLEVMEVNALPGLHPTHSDLPIMCAQVGMGYDALIRTITESACLRLPSKSSFPEAPKCAS